MSRKKSANVALCQAWYAAFDRRDLPAVMALFTDDVVVVVGAGGSSTAVAYSGTFAGRTEVEKYYRQRFSHADLARSPLRPSCGIEQSPVEFGPWVIFTGNITDARKNGTPTYKGGFVHVWHIDPDQQQISSLEMFLDPASNLVAATRRRKAR
jgi:hypothetical protein